MAVIRPTSLALLCCVPGFVPGLAWALASDREQPVHIQADHVVLDEQQGISHYTGHVRLEQGTLTLSGERMTVRQSGRELQSIQVHGTPARFSQLPDDAEAPVRARARSMTYRSAEDRLVLEGEAHVTQAGNVFQGGRIVYDTRRSAVTASGGQERERVHVIIQPEKQTGQ